METPETAVAVLFIILLLSFYQMSRSSSDSDSEQEQSSPGRRSAQARIKRDSQQNHDEMIPQDGDICVGCLAAALNRKQKNSDTCAITDDVDSDVSMTMMEYIELADNTITCFPGRLVLRR